MRSFRAARETEAQTGKKIEIGDELLEAHIIAQTGWTVFELRATPQHVLDELLYYWKLQSMQDEYIAKKNAPKEL